MSTVLSVFCDEQESCLSFSVTGQTTVAVKSYFKKRYSITKQTICPFFLVFMMEIWQCYKLKKVLASKSKSCSRVYKHPHTTSHYFSFLSFVDSYSFSLIFLLSFYTLNKTNIQRLCLLLNPDNSDYLVPFYVLIGS